MFLLPFQCGGCQYFEATQIGSNNKQYLLTSFTLPDRFSSVFSLTDINIVHLCCLKVALYKHPPWKLFYLCWLFGIFCLVFTLLSFASSFFSKSERLLELWILTKCCIYFLIYACVTIQRFGAALVAVSSWIISWYPLGLFCQILKMCWYCFERQYNILDEFYCK